MKKIRVLILLCVLLATNSCKIFRPQPKFIYANVDAIFSSIHDQYYEALQDLNLDPLAIDLNPLGLDVTLSNVITTTTQAGLKAFVVTGNYKHTNVHQTAITYSLAPPPPIPKGGNFLLARHQRTPEEEKLYTLIKQAAMAFNNVPNLGALNDHQITIDLTFTFSNDGSVSVTYPINTNIGPTASLEKNYQNGNEIKLKFEVTHKYGAGNLFLSPSEYNNLYKTKGLDNIASSFNLADKAAIPESVLLLNTPPVGNQVDINSCTGWAVGYTYLSKIWKDFIEKRDHKQYSWNEDIERSPIFIYSQLQDKCGDVNLKQVLDLFAREGDCSLKEMPSVDDCKSMHPPTQSQFEAAKIIKPAIRTWYNLDPNNVDQYKVCLANDKPVIVAFYMSFSFKEMWRSTSIWRTASGPYSSGHCVCIIGYDDKRHLFKAQNQWGLTNSNHDGYFWVTYDMVENGCFREAYVFN